MDNQHKKVQFGAVYFRKTAPPREDWERDYKTAAEAGHNMFRHWFSWGAIETAPGEYDWEDYDRQLDLAEKYGINTVIAEMIVDVPEWLYSRYPHARIEDRQGRKRVSEMHGSSATGGHHCMCLDNPEVEEAAERFLTELVKRYRNHPGLYGYDIWNESTFYTPDRLCYCPATQQRFREWLKVKYGNVKDLAKTWLRFSYTSWEEVEMPRQLGPYPETFDFIQFQNDHAFKWMKWRADIIKGLDSEHPVIAHGNARSFNDIATCCGDDWRAADHADIFGYTYYYGIACHPLMAGDLIRGASRGKEFWRAEAVGNSDWQRRRAEHKPHLEKERMAEPENIRLDSMVSFAAGARGYINPRWRPLLNGPLFGAFGWYGMDGSETERSQMAKSIAQWVHHPQTQPIWDAAPIKGEIAILLLEESQAMCYALYGDEDSYNLYYSQCVQGAYQAFLDSNIQCDFIRLDQIDEYKVLYLPFPIALSSKNIERLSLWVEKGGCLISEGCPGYFTEYGTAVTRQPNRGFERLFGCVEQEVSFGADMWNDLKFITAEGEVSGGLYRQSYLLQEGQESGSYADGQTAVVDHEYGKGKTRLVGTMPGYGYRKSRQEESRRWFESLLSYAGAVPRLKTNDPNITARLCQSGNQYVLWVLNFSSEKKVVKITMNQEGLAADGCKVFRGLDPICSSDGSITLEVEGRDASVLGIL